MVDRLSPPRGHAVVFALVVLVWASCSRAQVVSSFFDSDSEGWSTYNDTQDFRWDPAMGQPPGSITARDRGTGIYWGFLAGPAFLGDRADAYGGVLSWTIRTTHSSNAGATQPDAALVGGGLTLVYDLPPPPANTWTPYEVILTEDAGWRLTSLGGQVPTPEQFVSVLADLEELRIRAEFSGSLDAAWLDNVVFGGGMCSADWNDDGSVNSDDFFAFLDDYFAGDADFNGDGTTNSDDYFAFLAAFFEGCP